MKRITHHTEKSWLSGAYTHDAYARPMVRVTIQKNHIHLINYRVSRDVSHTWAHKGVFASAMFGMRNKPRELRNVKSVSWQRGVGQDVATCKIVLYNTQKLPHGNSPPNRHDFDLPGWYTPNRGQEKYFDRWNYQENSWHGWLAPDRIIKTYEGYGFDDDIPPDKDPKMYPSGVWLIDDVTFTTDGLIEINCRDVGRLLMDHIMFTPVVPWSVYPLYWSKFENEPNRDIHSGPWQTPNYGTDSNRPRAGTGFGDVTPNGSVHGHHGQDAFDGNPDTYWLSVGSKSSGPPSFGDRSQYEYIQGTFSSRSVEAVRVVVKGGPYRMFVSLRGSDGQWRGRPKIPYQPREGGIDTGADIPYVYAITVEPGENIIRLNLQHQNMNAIRLTFGRLWDSRIGPDRYRAAVKSVQVAPSVTVGANPGTHKIGNYGDYTDIVKWLLAWGGFYWPRGGSGHAFQTRTDDTRNHIAPHDDDPVLGKGRVWGDFEQSGTTGIVQLGVEMWDKKPLMDGIAQIREMVGFDFWIDETGGAVWRLPHIFSKGNYIMPTEGGRRVNRTDEIPVLDERTVLIEMGATMDSSNIRERIFVANIAGHKGAVVRGYNPYRSMLRRVGGWTDQRFESEAECERMADLIAMKQALLYRQNNLTIAANPQIQIDDQVRIYERTTGEGYVHRVLAISMDFDNETGRWTYGLTTHWMGDDPGSKKWAFNAELLQDATQRFLRAAGKIS